MTLFITCILIYLGELPWYMYVIASLIWLIHLGWSVVSGADL